MSQRPTGQIVTRFAPSPTGYLHIGGARTALFNWAFARRHGGVFILRIEDTDKARSTNASTQGIIEDMRWLGIDWDEGPNPAAKDVYALEQQRGAHGPYFQSQRDALYKEYLQRFIDSGQAYKDGEAYRFKMPESDITVNDLVLGDVTIKRENLEDFVIVKSDGGPTFHFANVVDDATMGVTHVLRAQEHLMNTPKHVAMFDALEIARPKYAHMPLIFNPNDSSKMSKRDKAKTARKSVQDLANRIVKSSDGVIPFDFALQTVWGLINAPLYSNFTDFITFMNEKGNSARLVDRINQEIAQLRQKERDEFMAFKDFIEKKNDSLDITQRISKGTGIALPEIDVHDFRTAGYLAPVILNYIALLGWSPGGNIERFDLDWLRQNFAIEGIGKSQAKFDREKLKAFNGDTLQKLSPNEFCDRLRAHLTEYHAEQFGTLLARAEFALFAEAYRPRSRTLDEPTVLGKFFIVPDDAIVFDPKSVDKVLKINNGAGLEALRGLLVVLERLTPWNPSTIHLAIEKFCADTGRGMGDVAQPLRVALTGTTVSPAIHDTLAILGKVSSLKRIERCLALT